jgi:hypothetical protein
MSYDDIGDAPEPYQAGSYADIIREMYAKEDDAIARYKDERLESISHFVRLPSSPLPNSVWGEPLLTDDTQGSSNVPPGV